MSAAESGWHSRQAWVISGPEEEGAGRGGGGRLARRGVWSRVVDGRRGAGQEDDQRDRHQDEGRAQAEHPLETSELHPATLLRALWPGGPQFAPLSAYSLVRIMAEGL